MPKPFTWSYTAWSTFKQCPLKYKLRYIDKIKDEPGPAAERGKHIHKLAEGFVDGHIKGLPKELKKFEAEFKELRSLKRKQPDHVITEFDASMSENWKPVTWDDWNNVSMRGFIDLLYLGENNAALIDYKTGKQYPGHEDQAHLYATATFCLDENIEEVTAEFWYLDSGAILTRNYHRDNLKKMITLWERRIAEMKKEKHFDAMPNPFCKWCVGHVSKGGSCDGR